MCVYIRDFKRSVDELEIEKYHTISVYDVRYMIIMESIFASVEYFYIYILMIIIITTMVWPMSQQTLNEMHTHTLREFIYISHGTHANMFFASHQVYISMGYHNLPFIKITLRNSKR